MHVLCQIFMILHHFFRIFKILTNSGDEKINLFCDSLDANKLIWNEYSYTSRQILFTSCVVMSRWAASQTPDSHISISRLCLIHFLTIKWGFPVTSSSSVTAKQTKSATSDATAIFEQMKRARARQRACAAPCRFFVSLMAHFLD